MPNSRTYKVVYLIGDVDLQAGRKVGPSGCIRSSDRACVRPRRRQACVRQRCSKHEDLALRLLHRRGSLKAAAAHKSPLAHLFVR